MPVLGLPDDDNQQYDTRESEEHQRKPAEDGERYRGSLGKEFVLGSQPSNDEPQNDDRQREEDRDDLQ